LSSSVGPSCHPWAYCGVGNTGGDGQGVFLTAYLLVLENRTGAGQSHRGQEEPEVRALCFVAPRPCCLR
ncbi:MAG: hypothetical protein ACQESR_28040, partial [Planctomycetota bacterium]